MREQEKASIDTLKRILDGALIQTGWTTTQRMGYLRSQLDLQHEAPSNDPQYRVIQSIPAHFLIALAPKKAQKSQETARFLAFRAKGHSKIDLPRNPRRYWGASF